MSSRNCSYPHCMMGGGQCDAEARGECDDAPPKPQEPVLTSGSSSGANEPESIVTGNNSIVTEHKPIPRRTIRANDAPQSEVSGLGEGERPRRPGRPPNSDVSKDKFATLKAWCHWVLKNPLDEDQRLHAMATNDLFSLLGTVEAQLASRTAEIEALKARVEDLLTLNNNAHEAVFALSKQRDDLKEANELLRYPVVLLAEMENIEIENVTDFDKVIREARYALKYAALAPRDQRGKEEEGE